MILVNRNKHWWNINKATVVFLMVLLSLGLILWVEEVPYYHKKLLWTKFSLLRARENVNMFVKLAGRNPSSLNEIVEYARKHPDSDLRKIPFGEYISDTNGNRSEHTYLDGSGGLYYNPKTA